MKVAGVVRIKEGRFATKVQPVTDVLFCWRNRLPGATQTVAIRLKMSLIGCLVWKAPGAG